MYDNEQQYMQCSQYTCTCSAHGEVQYTHAVLMVHTRSAHGTHMQCSWYTHAVLMVKYSTHMQCSW